MAAPQAVARSHDHAEPRARAHEVLGQLERLFIRTLESSDPIAIGPALPVARATSKRVRPALVLAAARGVGLERELALELATAVELVHTFSLVHDDIEDDATLRRGQPAVHTVVGVPIAINTGDALHALAWTALLSLDAPAGRIVETARQFAVTLDRMVAGQARDLLWTRERKTDLGIDEYIEMVRGKTGALLGFAAAAPAWLVGHPGARQLAIMGENLGVAFQILDDVASLRSSMAVLGKPVGADANGAGSAPALLAAAGHDGTDAAIELANEYWRRARTMLAASEVAADAGLCELADLVIDELLARYTGA